MSEIIKVRLHGGPCHEQELELPLGTTTHGIGEPIPFWVYEDTGYNAPDGRKLFAVRPRERGKRQGIKFISSTYGQDPRLYDTKKQAVRSAPPARGRGKRRRDEQRAVDQ